MSKNTEPVENVEGVKAKRTNVATSLDAETLARFEETAWARRHRRNSDALREAIDEWIARHGNVGAGEAPDAKQ